MVSTSETKSQKESSHLDSSEPGGELIGKASSFRLPSYTSHSQEGSTFITDNSITDTYETSDDQESKLTGSVTFIKRLKSALKGSGKHKSIKKRLNAEAEAGEDECKPDGTETFSSVHVEMITEVEGEKFKSEDPGVIHVDSTSDAEKKHCKSEETPSYLPYDDFSHLTGNIEEESTVTDFVKNMQSTSETKSQKESSHLDSSEPGGKLIGKASSFRLPSYTKDSQEALKGSETFIQRVKSGVNDLGKHKQCQKDQQTEKKDLSEGSSKSIAPDTVSITTKLDQSSFYTEAISQSETEGFNSEEIQPVGTSMSKTVCCMPSLLSTKFTYTTSDPIKSKLQARHLDSSDQSENEACQLQKTKTLSPEISAISLSQKPQHTEKKHIQIGMDLQKEITSIPAEWLAHLKQLITNDIIRIFDFSEKNISDAIYIKLETIRDTLIVSMESTFEEFIKSTHMPSTSSSTACERAKYPQMATPSKASYPTSHYPSIPGHHARNTCHKKRPWYFCFKKNNKVAPLPPSQQN
ncbi:uncharacterized protein LOC124858991 [Girardinichthys multiradiatus]|uniref:uncharacterized protein LOC124858991 n=1 Tax=Girardinichthys multiradiatus TaxID=208333 RepID=UPI001FAD4957|nr:uncharacterized protein LOC124858991 [Girardinichthys multiradiatus]